MPHHIWYHSPCCDGLGAAYAAWTALGETGIRYTPVAYGDPLPPIEPDDEVTLLDFSASRQALLQLAQTAGRITIIDHHASAERALAGIGEEAAATEGACEIQVTFDMTHSGAVLAWQHFYRAAPPPKVLELIEDRDLWRFTDPGSRDLYFALEHLRDFRDLEQLARSPKWLAVQIENGRIIRRYLEGVWQGLAARASVSTLALAPSEGGEPAEPAIPCVLLSCAPSWFSDVGHTLLEAHPEAQIAALYHDNLKSGYTTWSLRSRQDGPDVTRIAVAAGGGGHPHAAGFRVPLGAGTFRLSMPTA
jgi:uncharacterized protein